MMRLARKSEEELYKIVEERIEQVCNVEVEIMTSRVGRKE